MYNIENIKVIHLELTSKCQASCPMCPRNIQGGIVNPWLNETEITIDQFKKWFSESFIRQLDRLFMCGNLGDAIVAKDTLSIFQYLRNVNPNIRLGLHTNGSAQTKDWWIKLAKTNVEVTFGIDGLSDTHSLYRIGTSFEKIIKNAQTFIQAGGRARWHMLVFAHNKHQILDCEKLSKELGFSEFSQKNSSRFRGDFLPVLSKEGKTRHLIYPSEKSVSISKKIAISKKDAIINTVKNSKINCKSKNENSLYVGADGSVAPCCWLDYSGTIPNSFSLVDYKDRGFKNPNLNECSLQEIFKNEYFSNIEKTWSNTPLRECSKQCGHYDKLNEQFK
jgi:MoaA/NifB/PqqE/SkfB family radical SAM enzyme